MFSASRRKSSSSTICSANSSTSAGGFASAATGMRPTSNGDSHASARRSSRTSAATRGRWTLTTTSSPVTRRAACTWAIDAAARGSGGQLQTCSSGRPRSRSTTARTSAKRSGGTWSRSFLNSDVSSSGKSPSKAETICPSFTYVDPRRSKLRRSRWARPARDPGVPRSRIHHPRDADAELGDDPQEAADGRKAPPGEQAGNLGPRAGRGSGRGGRATPTGPARRPTALRR